ncbi:MAG TPA: type II and III secretion system protein [Candidatus Sulfotelmatobacter sp.]|nr:type II and III secretion system protein [Candidatus Sulfotelmatobacter sp.]
MARALSILITAVSLAVIPARAGAAGESLSPPVSCANGLVGGINCLPTKEDLKQSREAFERGVRLHHRDKIEEAFLQFDEAARLNPQNIQYVTTREAVKAALVFQHVQRGNLLLLEDARLRAAMEFRAALELDPENQFAQERLQEATRQTIPILTSAMPEALAGSQEIHLEPVEGRATFHFTGDTRSLFNQLASAYSVKVQFDDSVQARPVVFNVDDVDFFMALKLACRVSKTMWSALDAHQFMIAADTPENHKQYDQMLLQRFILPPHSTPQEATDLITTMRNMFDLRFVSSGQTADTVEVRGPAPAVRACAQLLRQLSNARPQVMFDIRVFQINHQLTRNMGVHIPNTFSMFNIPAAALAGLGGQNIQDLINQIISSGGINQLGNTALSGLLSQLGGQQNSIFSQPLATFGGGLTFMGLSLGELSATLSVNESWVRSLEDMSIRAAQGSDATFHLGQRYPILNASYAPIYNSPQISQVLGNQSYIPPFPSVSYEDLGLNVKVKPTIHGDGTVSLQLEMQVRSLTGQSNNGVPVISNREYKGSITLKDGEPAFVAGEISKTDTMSMSGIPGLGFVPGLNMAMTNNTKQEQDDELMIAITPHVLANFERSTQPIWVSER